MNAIRHFLIDVEGTIVVDKSYTPIPGAVEWVNGLRENGKTFLLVTNNTTHAPEELAEELASRGFDVGPEHIHSCLTAALQRIQQSKRTRCFVIGSQRVKDYFRRMGLEVNPKGAVDWVVVGLDVSLNYQTIKKATMALLEDKAGLLGLHANRLFRDEDGSLAPSVGAIVRALEFACDIQGEIVGKPNHLFFQGAMKRLRAKPEETLMIGDDPFTDLVGAKRLGIRTAFVLSGKYQKRKIVEKLNKDDKPDVTVERINDLGERGG